MVTDNGDLLMRIGALYVGLVRAEEKNNELEDSLKRTLDREQRMSGKLGNALAHLEVHDEETYRKIMAGETVPVLGDG